jgi:hypothetical protein
MFRKLVGLVVLLTLTLAGIAPVAAQDEGQLAGLGLPELTFVVTEDGVEAPSEVPAGQYLVVLENQTQTDVDLTFYQFPAGMSLDDVMATPVAEEEVPSWLFDVTIAGGTVAAAGETGRAVVNLGPGEWFIELFRGDEEDAAAATPSVLEDATPQAGPIEEEAGAEEEPLRLTVTAAASPVPVAEISAGVRVEMQDFAFTMPSEIPAGPQIWEVTNVGQQPHFIVIVKGPETLTMDQVQAILEAEMTGGTPPAGVPNPETDFADAGFVQLLSTGQSLWTEFDLAPGTYVALCFFPDEQTGAPHAALGMVTIFTVA